MSETRNLFESFQNNLNESQGRKLSFEEYKDLYDPYCNLTDDELYSMWQADKDKLYTDEEIDQIKSEVEGFFDMEESALNEAKVDLSKLTNELESEMKKYITEPEIGFDAERNPNDRYNMYYGDYCEIKVETDEDGDYLIRANAELGYDSLTGLADRLDKIVSKYDKDAYFEPEDSGRLVCYMSKKLIKESALNEDDSFYNELEVTKYRPTGQTEGALANMTIKSKFGELNVNLLNIDGEYRIVTPNMFRTKEEEELINNLVNEYTLQGLIDFAADYHYKQTHMNESALNEKSTEKDVINIHTNIENSNSFDEIQNIIDYIKDNELRKEVQISLDDCKNRNYNLEDTKEQVIETLENSAEYTNEGDSLEDVRKDSIEKGLLSEDYNPLSLKLFMNTWGNYNENGADVDSIGGGWMDIEQAKDFLEKHSDEEPFINDVDGWTPFEINEYSNVEQVIEWLEAYENLSANEQEAFAAIMEDQNDDFESTMNILDSGDYIFFAGVDNEKDLGEAWYNMVGGYDGISNPENYIDEDAYKESWRDAAEEDIRNENPDVDEGSDEFEDLVQNWLDTVALEELQNEIDSGADLSDYFDYEALGNDLYNDGFYFATTGAIQIL